MKKKDIFLKLKEQDLKKTEYIIIDEASLVFHGILKETDEIHLGCKKEKLEELKNQLKDESIKIYEYSSKDVDEINGYFCMKLEESLLQIPKENKQLIKKIELAIDCQDTYRYERGLREKGITYIGGVDEVGRGPLVGPVVAACCILPETFHLDGLTDSKKLSEAKREYFYEEIKKQAISYGIGIVDEDRIDEINIYEATKEAMIIAIENCHIKPEYVLTDAMKLDLDVPVMPLIKGDLRSITISAASVLAKVTRDHMLYELDKKYPMYDFKNNVGYPTKKHLDAIEKYGIIKEHRKSYGPVKEYIERHKV